MTINYKKQDFNENELALFFQSFGKSLFTRPKEGDIKSILIDRRGSCSLFFHNEYYELLKNDIVSAYEQGKFALSNAKQDWENLMKTYLSATDEKIPDSNKIEDYYTQVKAFWS